MSNALIPFEQQQHLAVAIAKSGMFGMKTPEQALVLMALCEAEGLHPAIAIRDFHIVEGRPALKADAMLARFQTAGGKVQWTCMTDERVAAVFSHPAGGSVELEWTIEMAKRAGLAGRQNWNKYPRAMLRARVISEGIRTVFPGVVAGTYTPEELTDGGAPAAQPQHGPKDMGAAEIVVELQPIIDRIMEATTVEALEAIRPDIRRLRGDDKQRALQLAKERAEHIRGAKAADGIDPETGEVIAQPVGEI